MFFNSRAVGLSVLTVLVAAVGVVAQLPNVSRVLWKI
jgi:hypothetical protein